MPASALCVTLICPSSLYPSDICSVSHRLGEDYKCCTGIHLWDARSSNKTWENSSPPNDRFSSQLFGIIFVLFCLCSFEEACQNVLQTTGEVLFFLQRHRFRLFDCKNTKSVLVPKPLKFIPAFISHPVFQWAGTWDMFWRYWFLACFSSSYSCLFTFWGFAVAQIKFLISSLLLNSLSERRQQETHLPRTHR